jgi:hypothetical protein
MLRNKFRALSEPMRASGIASEEDSIENIRFPEGLLSEGRNSGRTNGSD